MCLVMLGTLGGCTINIYHVAPEDAGAMLVVPDAQSGTDDAQQTSPPYQVVESSPHSSPTTRRDILSMRVDGLDDKGKVPLDELVNVEIASAVDAYVNCYYQSADNNIIKIFPNRYAPRYWLYANQQIALPNEQYFHIIADTPATTESFMCLASSEDVLNTLPRVYQANVFQTLPVDSFDAMYALYRQATTGNLVGRVISYEIQ